MLPARAGSHPSALQSLGSAVPKLRGSFKAEGAACHPRASLRSPLSVRCSSM